MVFGTGQPDPTFAALAKKEDDALAIWVNAPGSLLYATDSGVETVPLNPPELRVNALETAGADRVWVGLELQGLALCSPGGCGERLTVEDGLRTFGFSRSHKSRVLRSRGPGSVRIRGSPLWKKGAC